MIDKKVNAEEQVQRMKNLMNYGLKENKQKEYSGVEYSKEAADGKLYGIVREGTKYYIKVAKNPKSGLVAENFDYIGGFRNRKDNMFESFAAAQRYFVEKMICINESVDDARKRVIAESWDLDAKKEVIEEGTKKMEAEIARQRQIMKNAQNINEGKKCDMIGGCPKTETLKVEEPKSKPGAPFTTVLSNAEVKDLQKDNIKGKEKPAVGNKKVTNESTEVPLSSRENPDYMDKSHGTEKGDNAPFEKEVKGGENKPETVEAEFEVEVVSEGTAMHDSQDINSPKPGVGEKGDNAPFEEKAEITEEVVDLDDELEDDEEVEDIDIEDADEEIDADMAEEGDDEDDIDADAEEDDETEDILEQDDDTEARLSALENKLDQILNAINDMKYDDDDELYDGEDEDEDDSFQDDADAMAEEEMVDDDVEVFESKSYRAMKARALHEEDDFGKHPAYQKVVMTTPATNMANKEGQYDMNDESVEGDKPYGINKGNQAPFEVSPEAVENAITEAVMGLLKKKLA